MTDLRKAAEEAAKVLANALSIDFNDKRDWYSYKHDVEYATSLLVRALAQPEQDWDLLAATQDSLREHQARIKEIEAQLAQLEQDHGFDRTASHMTGEYVDTAQPDLSIEANRVAYDVAMHYANKTKEKLG